MPHKCLRCGSEFPDGSNRIFKNGSSSCPDCGCPTFLHIRNDLEDMPRLREISNHLKDEGRKVRISKGDRVETIRGDSGLYKVDLPKLLEHGNVVWALREGEYIIRLPSIF